MSHHFTPLPTDQVRALQAGGPDAHGRTPERQISDGTVGCRHCHQTIPKGQTCLLVAYTPFLTVQPYAETGPLFLCARPCAPAKPAQPLPGLLTSQSYILRGYDAEERIIYGTGEVTARRDFDARIEALFARDDVRFIDVRSAANNCFQCRIQRA